MMDLADIIFDPDWHVTLEIQRRGGAWNREGEWVAIWQADTIDAAVHPATPSDLLMLAEGERAHPAIKIYSAQPLGFGDLVSWDGETYKVVFRQDWGAYGFWDCLAIRPSPTAAPDGAAFALA